MTMQHSDTLFRESKFVEKGKPIVAAELSGKQLNFSVAGATGQYYFEIIISRWLIRKFGHETLLDWYQPGVHDD